MSKASFEDRLQRINHNSPQQKPVQGARPAPRKTGYGSLAIGAVLVVLASQTIKYTNENYEVIKDTNGIGAAAGLGLFGLFVFLVGITVLIRAFRRLLSR